MRSALDHLAGSDGKAGGEVQEHLSDRWHC